MKGRKKLVSIIFVLFINVSLGQDCNNRNWQQVEVRLLTHTELPSEYHQNEEGAVISRLHGPIKKVDDLNKTELNEIKKMASKYNSCIVYIDIDNISNRHYLKPNELYYFWIVND